MRTAISKRLAESPTPAHLDAWLDDDPRIVSEHTRRGYRRDICEFETWRNMEQRPFSKLTLNAYAAHLLERGLAVSTVNRKLSALRWYARRAADQIEETPMEPAQRRALVRNALRAANTEGLRDRTGPEAKLKGRHVAADEITRLLIACEGDITPAGLRDAALIATSHQTALRRSELAALTLADITAEDEGYTLTIQHGKGGKRRQAYMYNDSARILDAWLEARGGEPGPVFCRIRKGGRLVIDNSLSGQGLQDILARRAEQANIQPLTWHDLRRTFAGDLLDMGIDVATVQKLMGHASSDTTTRYDRRPRRTRQDAARKRGLPYTWKGRR
jgi:site-specific recombinase XerD